MSNSNLFKEIEKPLTQILDLDELKEKIDQVNSDRRILIVDDEPYNIMGLKI